MDQPKSAAAENISPVISRALVSRAIPAALAVSIATIGPSVIPLIKAKATNMIRFSGWRVLHIREVKTKISSAANTMYISAGVTAKY